MKFLENLKLDSWWKAVLYLGVGGIVCSFLFEVDFVEAKHIFGLCIGMVMIGISYWIAEKELAQFKPPNAYTGPGGFVTWKEIRHNPITVVLIIIGIGLVGLFGVLIVKDLI